MTCFYKFPDISVYKSFDKENTVDELGYIVIGEEINGETEEIEFIYSKEYHVNTIWPVPEWEQYRIYPNTPMRIIG